MILLSKYFKNSPSFNFICLSQLVDPISVFYQIHMRKNETCKKLCDSTIPATDASFVNQAIQDRYALNWLIDG